MRKVLFRLLASMNKRFLPRMSGRDLNRLTRAEKLIVAWRYWVTRNALD